MNYNLKKGISPIVASVLLIAFSTAIAAVVGTWAMSYTQSELTNIELCEDVNVKIIEVTYDPSSKEGSFRIQNTGPTIDKYDVYVLASGNLEEKVKEITTPLKKLEKKTIIFESEMENVKGVKIEVPACFGKSFFGFIE
jgi:flagellin-like protein